MSAHRTERPTSELPDTEVSGTTGPLGEPDRPASSPEDDPTTSARTVDDRPRTDADPAPTATVPVVPVPGGGDDVSGDDHERMEVSGTQVAASVLASVSAAVIASFFGVAGTIVGTAVVSVVATVGSAAYRLGINRTQRRLQRLQAVQALRTTRPLPLVTGRSRDTSRAEGTEPAAGAASPSSRWPGWLAQRRWGLAAGVAIVFLVSLGTVTLVEVIGDRPLAGESSGGRTTSLGSILADDSSDEGDGGGEPDPSTQTPVTTTPGDDATTDPDDGHGDDGDVDEDGSSATTPIPDADDPSGPTDPTDPSTDTTSPTSPTTPTTAPQNDPATVDPVPPTTPPEVGSSPPAA